MYTQVYDVGPNQTITMPRFLDEGRIFVSFVPKGEELYIESDEYRNNINVFTAYTPEQTQAYLARLR